MSLKALGYTRHVVHTVVKIADKCYHPMVGFYYTAGSTCLLKKKNEQSIVDHTVEIHVFCGLAEAMQQGNTIM